jgi:hypothetical protein
MSGVCTYCGTRIVGVDVQRRAADEGQELVMMCENCIIDVKLCYDFVDYESSGVCNSYVKGVDSPYCTTTEPFVSPNLTNFPYVTEYELSCGGEMAKLGFSKLMRSFTMDSIGHCTVKKQRGISTTFTSTVMYNNEFLSSFPRRRGNDYDGYETVTKVVHNKRVMADNLIFKHSMEWNDVQFRGHANHVTYTNIYTRLSYYPDNNVQVSATRTTTGDKSYYSVEVELVNTSIPSDDVNYMVEYIDYILDLCGYVSVLVYPTSCTLAYTP